MVRYEVCSEDVISSDRAKAFQRSHTSTQEEYDEFIQHIFSTIFESDFIFFALFLSLFHRVVTSILLLLNANGVENTHAYEVNGYLRSQCMCMLERKCCFMQTADRI